MAGGAILSPVRLPFRHTGNLLAHPYRIILDSRKRCVRGAWEWQSAFFRESARHSAAFGRKSSHLVLVNGKGQTGFAYLSGSQRGLLPLPSRAFAWLMYGSKN